MKVEVPFQHKLEDGRVQCGICPHNCRLKPGQRGICRVRANENGALMARNYGEVSSLALDPIEKKPLYHFHPGSPVLSLGTVGCNFACGFCQNYRIAQEDPATDYLEPAGLLALAGESSSRGSIGIAYTYSEPLMWYEYLREVMPLIAEAGMLNILVTNGYINHQPLMEILPYVDAMNIDLKSFTEDYYHRHCKGRLEPVKETITACAGHSHLELTTLLIPGENDSTREVEELARWLASVDPLIPLHLSAYYPAYHFRIPPTPAAALVKARETAREYLKYVYVGNVEGIDNNTRCPNCGAVLVVRNGYRVEVKAAREGGCPSCGDPVPYIA
jgi:pyruvate formate lyase activating enzyme